MRSSSSANRTALRLFLINVAFVVAGLVVYFVLTAGIIATGSFDPSDLAKTIETTTGRQLFRLSAMLSNLLPFAGASVAAFYVVYRSRWSAAAGLDRRPAANSIFWSVLFFVVALPLVGYLAYENLQLELPDWAQASEDNNDEILKGILQMDNVGEFLVAFLTVAVTPALGEELLMRGVLQRRVFQVWFGNAHAAIWVAAFLFSFVHFEFGGFAPRMLLGVLLGYAYYWSNSLWVPVGLHLAFNGLQVITAYVTGEFDPTADASDAISPWIGLGSLLAAVVVFYLANGRFDRVDTDDPFREVAVEEDIIDDGWLEEDDRR